jgi:tRNA modification GTPase
MTSDTICAPATAPLQSALALVRLSGPDALAITSSFFPSYERLQPRKAVYGPVVDHDMIVDDVIAVWYKAPHSFSGEDLVEISCHGSPLIVQKILSLMLRAGARLAGPGEFSRQAFLNGKIDLTGAEAINRIIGARGEKELSLAIAQMHGSLRTIVQSLRDQVLMLAADIECRIDFAGEQIEFAGYQECLARVERIAADVQQIHARCRMGARLAHGLDVVIAGKPNVGKSSLLNLLVNAERAIVSDIPGTTRDLIRESVQIAGVHLNLTDTAGIRETGCGIEKIGIEKSRQSMDNASIVLMVCDLGGGITDEDISLKQELAGKQVLYIGNKADIAGERLGDAAGALGVDMISFSAKSGEGIDTLENALRTLIDREFVDTDSSLLADTRVMAILEKAGQCCDDIRNALQLNEPEEFVAVAVRSLAGALGEITGDVSVDDVLDSIFSRFCIGK